MTRILILGATGHIGGLTAQALTAHYPDADLRLTSSRESGCQTLRRDFPKADVMIADWYDLPSLKRAINGVDKILVVTPDFLTNERVVTPNIIEAAKEAGNISQIVRLIAIPPGLTEAKLTDEYLATRCGANLHVIAKPLFDASGLPMTYINVPCWIMFNLPWFFAPEVKANRRVSMPSATDAARLWISEQDIADVAAKILAADAGENVGKEHILVGTERLDYLQITKLISDVIGEPVSYVDDQKALQDAMGDAYPTLMTYFRHETVAYNDVPVTNTVERLLGRPQVEVLDYLKANRADFV